MKKVAFAVLLSWQVLHADNGSIRVVNGASFVGNTSLAPGAFVSIFGENLTNTTAVAPNSSNLPQTLGGVTVNIRGNLLSLLFVAPTQINAIIPSIPPGPATLTVTSPTGSFSKSIVLAANSAPGLFSLFGTGTRDGAIENATAYVLGPYTVTTKGAATPLAIFMTGLDLSGKPTVTIGGIPVPVTFYGPAPCCAGIEQVNVQLTPALAGAGRVDLAVTSGGNTGNIVEVVILPNPGQGPYPPSAENTARSREISSIAYVPHTSLALVTDENDDAVRIIDVQKQAVTGVITLPEGALPVAVAVDDAGTKAVVAERNRAKIAVINIADARVSTEIAVGGGPSSLAFAGAYALVANQDSDSLSVVDLAKNHVTTVNVGRGPRGVAADVTANKVYVTNEDDGTVSVVDLLNPLNPATIINLPANARPSGIQLVTGLGLAVITEPAASASGRAYVVALPSGSVRTVLVNSSRDGGSNGMASYAGTVYFANQSGGSVSTAQFTPSGGFTSTTMKVDLGTRALAVDTLDGLLLAANEGSGTVVLANLTGTQIIGRINAIRGPSESAGQDLNNHNDRPTAANAPAIASINPSSASGGSSFTITINGTNLQAADSIFFVDPSTLPGHGNGHAAGEGGDEHWHGPFGVNDTHIHVSNIVANQAGNQLSATVTVSGKSPRGVARVVRVETPNGDTSFAATSANTFRIN